MRRLDEHQMDPQTAARLEAIDATLGGEPVDPQHAELAELALLLASERPEIDPGFASSLDQRVQQRFAAEAHTRGHASRWKLAGAAGTALAAVLAVVLVVSSGGSPGPPGQHAARSTPAAASAPAAPRRAARVAARSAAAPSAAATSAASAGPTTGFLQPPANGRKIIQGAQLALTAIPTRIEDVAQQVFGVVAAENGIVNHSTVTATGGPDGYAELDLSVPSAGLPDTMARLSRLRYAQVASRTDTTQDVNNQFLDASRRLGSAQGLRTSLLRQLANASAQQQIDSLRAQIRDAEAQIAGAQSDLRSLSHQIGYSRISLVINAHVFPVSHGGSLTLGRAAHDAGRVLTVIAGAGLIALAALVPVGLLAALAGWLAVALRRRRRERALDLA